MAAPALIKLRVEILNIAPPIWRQIAVPDDLSLDELHLVIQEAFGWTGSHLHEFRTRLQRFSGTSDEPDRDFLGDGDRPPSLPEDRVSIAQVLKRKGAQMIYTYDFGDNWEHLITHQGPCTPAEADGLVRVLGGARACPPENCGSIPGYESLLEAMKNPAHPEREELLEWLGGKPFNPEAFDLKKTNASVRKLVQPARGTAPRRSPTARRKRRT